jgi:hypothetical protein
MVNVEFTSLDGVVLNTKDTYCNDDILVKHNPSTVTVRVVGAIASIPIPYLGLDTDTSYLVSKEYISDEYYFRPYVSEEQPTTFSYTDLQVVKGSTFEISNAKYTYKVYRGLFTDKNDLPATAEVITGEFPIILEDVTIVVEEIVQRVETIEVLNAQDDEINLRPIILCKLFYNLEYWSCVKFAKAIYGTDGTTVERWEDLGVVDFIQTMSTAFPPDTYVPVNGAYFVISDYLLQGSLVQQYFTAGTYKMSLYLQYDIANSNPANLIGDILTFTIKNK